MKADDKTFFNSLFCGRENDIFLFQFKKLHFGPGYSKKISKIASIRQLFCNKRVLMLTLFNTSLPNIICNYAKRLKELAAALRRLKAWNFKIQNISNKNDIQSYALRILKTRAEEVLQI